MANGPNRMTRRLAITIAAFITRYGVWPSEARLSPWALYWIAQSLDEGHFARLADRLKMRVTKHADIAVGGPGGHVVYLKHEDPPIVTVERVERELGFTEIERSATRGTRRPGRRPGRP
jgi:hypothetical protein